MSTTTIILPTVKNFINGDFDSNPKEVIDVISPLDGSVISTVPMSGYNDLDQAVKAAEKAYPIWSSKTLKERVQILSLIHI